MIARITLKPGVRLSNLQPQIVLALQVAAGCYGIEALDEMVVTSCNDSTHRRGSLHYAGAAVDLRSKSIPADAVERVVERMKVALGVDFDVVLEAWNATAREANEHIHLEYQPKS